MTVKDLNASGSFEMMNHLDGEGMTETAMWKKEIQTPFCCDLLSLAMSRAPQGCAWVTVMGNINTLAVASLTEAACVIFAEGVSLDETALKKADEQGIPVFRTNKPVFEAALEVDKLIRSSNLTDRGCDDCSSGNRGNSGGKDEL